MQITVNVTEKHIAEGVRGDCAGCPIALALRDAGHPNPWVGVGQFRLSPGGLDKAVVYGQLPRKAMEFIYRFESRYSVSPATFVLEVDG